MGPSVFWSLLAMSIIATSTAAAENPNLSAEFLKPVVALNFEPNGSWSRDKDWGIRARGISVDLRTEGTGGGLGNLTIVDDPVIGIGHALHYLITNQTDDHKARLEHYMHIAPMRHTFVSEFSLKLDKGFTPRESVTPAGGENWLILRQWHQCAPESPPLSLSIKNGTNNVLSWLVISGKNKHESQESVIGTYAAKLDHWYHIRMRWNISPPNTNKTQGDGGCKVYLSDTVLPKDLTEANVLFNYQGPIGYADRPGHDGDNIREQQGIYQGAHTLLPVHHGYCIDNVAIYEVDRSSKTAPIK